MIVRCTHCGAENRLGAIFCHDCGERLDMDAVEDQLEEGKKKEKTKSVLSRIRNIISVILLICVILILAGLFVPVSMKYEEPPERTVIREAQEKTYQVVNKRLSGSGQTEVEFSEAELTAAVNGESGLYEKLNERREDDEAALGVLEPELISVTFLPGRRVKAVLRLGLYKNFKMYNTLILDLNNGGEDQLLKPEKAKIGRVPMPGPLKALVTGRFESLFTGTDAASEVEERVEDIIREDDELIFILRGK